MNPIIFIPARLAATRLPHKPLLDINGKPMILRVYERAVEANMARVCVAAGDAAIVDCIKSSGGEAILTDPKLPSGSDRIWAALQIFDPKKQHDVIVNLQGDLPNIDGKILRAILQLMEHPDVDIGTAAAKITDPADIAKPNVVKIAMAGSRALYFSRSPIPHGASDYYHHIGIYAYRRQALERFIQSAPSPLEVCEKLEQLRALELGMRIDVAIVDNIPLSVDTPEDLAIARKMIK